MTRMILLFVISILSYPCIAASVEFEAAVNQAKLDGNSKIGDSIHHVQQFDPKSVFAGYSKSPDQSKYYQGERETESDPLAADAMQSKTSESGMTISTSINEHPQFVIHNTDTDIQHSRLLQSEAANILHGVTSQYTDCKPKQACTQQYQQQHCEEPPKTTFQGCKKTLKVEIIAHETVTHYPLTAHLTVKDHNYAGISMNAVNGRIDFLGPHDASFQLDGRLPDNIDCHTFMGAITTKSGNASLDHINFPSCSNGLGLDFHISGGHNLHLQIDMASKVVSYETKDHWVDDCIGFATDSMCKLQSQQCDISGSTQVIQGNPVTRDCWQQEFNYICHAHGGEENCKPLQLQGCEQIGSECKNKTNGQCSLYDQTYRCPLQSCVPIPDVVCGNGQEYCLDGNCTDQHYQKSQDFAEGVSELSAVAEGAKEFDQSAQKMFAGHSAECSEKPIGFSNCCAETGWGHDIGLANCPDAAKRLHKDRQAKLVVKVGRYCSGPDLLPCSEHSQVFCVFSSKLAKILQEQGRGNQLHISFGNAKEPRCQGISALELQGIDLAKIDFTDFVTDLQSNLKNPDLNQIQDRVRKHVKQYQDTGNYND